MGNSQKFYVMDKDGNFEKYDSQFDITIHFECLEDQKRFMRILEELNNFRLDLPRQKVRNKEQTDGKA